tara:strand:- start:9271 stop:10980 length:1710 start_codon:yes stop_codon:yes gene_type:complete
MSNRSRSELVDALQELVELLTLAEGGRSSFRARAFASAAKAVEDHAETSSMSPKRLMALPGIGKSTAETIKEYFATGQIARLEELRAQYPAELVELTRIPGLGAKTVLRLRDEAGIANLAGLRAAIVQERVGTLPGLAGWTEERLATAIAHIGGKHDRQPIHRVLPMAEALRFELSQLPEVSAAFLGGSLRRQESTIADVDVLVATEDPASVIAYFLDTPRVTSVIVTGEKMVSVYVENGDNIKECQVDLRTTPAAALGPALLHFSSGREHNIRLRMRAHDLGFSLNENSLHHRGTDDVICQGSEEELYAMLGLPWFVPGLRQGQGEIAAGLEGRLPKVVEPADVRGDLLAEGQIALLDLVKAAQARSYEYISIVNASEDAAEQSKSWQEVAALRKQIADMLILHACIRDLDADGYVECSADDRANYDFCIARVSGHLQLSERQQTDRLLEAMEDPAVRIISQLTARRIGEFRGIEFDVQAVLDAAKENDVAIEIASDLQRLDPPSAIVRRGCENGNLFVVSSRAPDVAGLAQIEIGIRHSHRGWLDKANVVNTWKRSRFEEWLRAPYS